jgi:hypothetical protein
MEQMFTQSSPGQNTIMDVNNKRFSAEQCRHKATPARQALGKLLAAITKPVSILAPENFHPLYENWDSKIQRSMPLAATKWVSTSQSQLALIDL